MDQPFHPTPAPPDPGEKFTRVATRIVFPATTALLLLMTLIWSTYSSFFPKNMFRALFLNPYSPHKELQLLAALLLWGGTGVSIAGFIQKIRKRAPETGEKKLPDVKAFVKAEKAVTVGAVFLCLTLVFLLVITPISKISKGSSGSSSRSSSSTSSGSSSGAGGLDAYSYALVYIRTSNVKIEHNSSYTVCTGTVTNTGTMTLRFLKIRGAFTDRKGTVKDTDWTYAIGSEGLGPGESTSFRMSCPVDRDIRDCKIVIIQ